jgi:hypothetical protein
MSKNDARRGTFEEDPQKWISLRRRITREIFMRGVAFWSIRASVLGRRFCVPGAALRMTWPRIFRGRHNTSDTWTGKIAKRIGMRPSALHSTFHYWRKSRRIAAFWMLSSSNNEEVSQNCFVFGVANFKNWGSLADLLRFWCCRAQKLRKSRRIASLSSLQIDR